MIAKIFYDELTYLHYWINIYVLPIKAMAIMVSFFFFIHMNVKEFKPQNHLMNF